MPHEEEFVRLLRQLGDRAVALNVWFFGPADVQRLAAQAGLTPPEIAEAFAVLLEKGIVTLERGATVAFATGSLTDVGLDCYLQACRPSYPAEQMGVRRKLAEHLIRETPGVTNLTFADELAYPRLVIDHILRVFATHGLLQITGPGFRDVGEVRIGALSPEIIGGQLLGYGL
jgi:DNA-binding transcriptional ArsR family regulator